MAVSIERNHDPAGVERILRALPSWFGIEESILQYVADAGQFPSYLARDGGSTVGIALVNRRYSRSAELHLLAVDPARHGMGVGTALVRAVKADLAADGVRVLQVHTVGPSCPDPGYQRTRAFYQRQQFIPLQEFDRLDWDGPTQILATAIDPDQPARPGGGDRQLHRWQFEMCWGLLDRQLEGLTDDDCRWPESAGWWTVRATGDGDFAADWAEPEPEPAPPATIGWLTWHVCWWWRSVIAGLQRLPLPAPAEVSWPGDARSTVQVLRAMRSQWLSMLDELTPDDLARTAVFPWHDDPRRTAAHVVWWVNSELMKNAAEIGLLRRMRELSR